MEKATVAEAELGTMFGPTELEARKQGFGTTHRITLLPENCPTDVFISRLAHEMSKRLLMVYDVAVVKSLTYQVTIQPKRQKVGGANSNS